MARQHNPRQISLRALRERCKRTRSDARSHCVWFDHWVGCHALGFCVFGIFRTAGGSSFSVEAHSPIRNSKMVLSIVNSGPPTHTVDTTVFEMWLGSLSTHQGLSIPVV